MSAKEPARLWGIAVSAAVMLVALVIAAPWRPQASSGVVQGLFQAAQAQGPPASPTPGSVSFVVRFRGEGPIARAQAQAARGRETQAARVIQAQLARQEAFDGLCFDRFTLGAAEVVLRSCADVSVSERAAYQTRWLARLNSMRAVDYADANTAVSPTRAPG